jgi:hypothetical protein
LQAPRLFQQIKHHPGTVQALSRAAPALRHYWLSGDEDSRLGLLFNHPTSSQICLLPKNDAFRPHQALWNAASSDNAAGAN